MRMEQETQEDPPAFLTWFGASWGRARWAVGHRGLLQRWVMAEPRRGSADGDVPRTHPWAPLGQLAYLQPQVKAD